MGLFDGYIEDSGKGRDSRIVQPQADIFGLPDFEQQRPSRNQTMTPGGKKQAALQKPKKKYGKGRAALLMAAIILLNIFGGGYSYYRKLIDSMYIVTDTGDGEEEEVVSPVSVTEVDDWELPEGAIQSDADIDLVLLVGCDSRIGMGKPSRSDTVILAAIDRRNKKIKLISLMRDLYVEVKNYDKDRINYSFYVDTALGYDDLRKTRDTIQRNLGIQVDKFAAVDFSVFETIVDELGGIDVNFDTPEIIRYMYNNSHYGKFPRFKELEPGVHHINGAEALVFSRARYVYTKNNRQDFDRTGRQRHVIDQIIATAKTKSVPKLLQVLSTVLPYIATNYSEAELWGYAAEIKTISGYEMKQLRIPIEGSYQQAQVDKNGTKMAVLLANLKWNGEQIRKFIYEDDMTFEGDDYQKATGVSIPKIPRPPVSESDTDTTTATTSAPTDTASG